MWDINKSLDNYQNVIIHSNFQSDLRNQKLINGLLTFYNFKIDKLSV